MRPDAGDAWKLVLIMALWAACFPLISVLLPLSPHLTLAALRAGIAGAALVLIGLIAGRALPKSAGEWRSIALTGLGATTLGFLGMVHAAAEVTPVRSVDRIQVGEGKAGPVTKRIQQRFMDIVTGKAPDVYGWLDRAPRGAAVAR